MTKLIAEIGWNHMGNISIAKKMIKSAKDNGADFVKTQIFKKIDLKLTILKNISTTRIM